jgi:hypothetical protein
MAEREITWTRKAMLDRTGIMEYWYNRTGAADYPVKLEKLFSSTSRWLRCCHALAGVSMKNGTSGM